MGSAILLYVYETEQFNTKVYSDSVQYPFQICVSYV